MEVEEYLELSNIRIFDYLDWFLFRGSLLLLCLFVVERCGKEKGLLLGLLLIFVDSCC